MNSVFQVCKQGLCGFKITGLETANDEYLDDPTKTSLKTYPFIQSVTLNAITQLQFDGTTILDKYGVTLHNTPLDETTLDTSYDGLYMVTHIILPTQVWLNLAISLNSLSVYTNIYYYDTTTSKFMKYLNQQASEVTIDEILGINVTDATTIVRSDKNTFCMCRLMACFYGKCKYLLVNLPAKCKRKEDEQSIYIRDLIWMGINAIKYSIDIGQYYQAQNILEQITGCNGLCNSASDSIKYTNYDCGCSK